VNKDLTGLPGLPGKWKERARMVRVQAKVMGRVVPVIRGGRRRSAVGRAVSISGGRLERRSAERKG
jgi:hypothetical protein